MDFSLSAFITIKDVMTRLFDKTIREPFSLTFISLDKERNKGGDIIKLEQAITPKSEFVKEALVNSGVVFNETNKRNPNHQDNNTINLTIPGANNIIKVHIDLITEFNNKRVIW